MCPRRKVKNAASILRHSSLVSWDSLDSLDKPPALNSYDEVQNIEDQSIVISLATPNLLQDADQKQEDKNDMEENEELTSSCASSEPSLNNAPITTTATSTEGENSLDVLNFSTNHAMTEQLLVEPTLDLPLSQDNLLHIPCDKDDLPDHEHERTEPHASAEFTNVIYIAGDNDELKLLSPLKTLGYIEFDVLCSLSDFEEKLFVYADLPWFSRHTYYVIGKHNNKGEYMVHRVYICSNLNSPFIVQHCDQVEGCNTTNPVMSSCSSFILKKQVYFKEGEQYWLLPTPYLPTKIKPRTDCCQEGEDDESKTPSDTTIDYKVSSFQINLSSGFENKLLHNDLIIVRNHGDDEEDIGEEFGDVVDQQGQRVGGPIQVKFESASESRSNPHQNQRPGCIRSPFWMLFIWMER